MSKELLSLRQYAKRRGVALSAVQKAIKTGRITPELDGKINPERCDLEWELSTDPSKQRSVEIVPSVEPEFDPETGELINHALRFQKAKAAREDYMSQMAKLELEEKSGKLVDADQVQQKWIGVATLVRTKVLGIPSKARQRIPELTADMYTALEMIVRETLEDLSDGDS